jgi:ArsR family transcriptional regulator
VKSSRRLARLPAGGVTERAATPRDPPLVPRATGRLASGRRLGSRVRLFRDLPKWGPDVAILDTMFRALGDPKRREILRLLRQGDLTAGEIAARFPVARSTLSEHLAVLREAGLVVTERRGSVVTYSLHVAAYEELVAAVMNALGVGVDRAG